MRRSVHLGCLLLLAAAFGFAEEAPLADFSLPAGARAGGILDPTGWKVLFLPSATKAESAAVALHDGALEASIDWSRAPAGTSGAALLAPSAAPGQPGTVENVGVVKRVELAVSAQGEGIRLSLVLADEKAQESVLFFGEALTAPRRLVWVNPDYVLEVIRREMTPPTAVPAEPPCLRLAGVVCTRPAAPAGRTLLRVPGIGLTYDIAFLDFRGGERR